MIKDQFNLPAGITFTKQQRVLMFFFFINIYISIIIILQIKMWLDDKRIPDAI